MAQSVPGDCSKHHRDSALTELQKRAVSKLASTGGSKKIAQAKVATHLRTKITTKV